MGRLWRRLWGGADPGVQHEQLDGKGVVGAGLGVQPEQLDGEAVEEAVEDAGPGVQHEQLDGEAVEEAVEGAGSGVQHEQLDGAAVAGAGGTKQRRLTRSSSRLTQSPVPPQNETGPAPAAVPNTMANSPIDRTDVGLLSDSASLATWEGNPPPAPQPLYLGHPATLEYFVGRQFSKVFY